MQTWDGTIDLHDIHIMVNLVSIIRLNLWRRNTVFLGVNSGVMLMNLTRMRKFNWTKYVIPIYKKYKLNITWGDQDIINIIFHYYPGKNFRKYIQNIDLW